jgi:hypothetical protein
MTVVLLHMKICDSLYSSFEQVLDNLTWRTAAVAAVVTGVAILAILVCVVSSHIADLPYLLALLFSLSFSAFSITVVIVT